MVFTGFHMKFPEYEVITPQTQLSFTVRSLTVQEEEVLKGSLVTPMRLTEHLNKCIWDCIVKKPDSIINYDSFLKNITLKDRDALLYGLYHVTYEEIRNYDLRCKSCRKEFPVSINASDTFSYFPYLGEEKIIDKRIVLPLKISKGVSAIIKQPTLFDEMSAYRELGSRPGTKHETVVEILIIEKFIQDVLESKENIEFTNKSDILDAYKSLPSKDKRDIYARYDSEFGQYKIQLKMKSYCPSCSEEDEYDIDLVDNFFRAVYGF